MKREIFSYTINDKLVYADPMMIERKWQAESAKVDIKSIMTNFYGPEFIRRFNDDGIPIDENDQVIPGITEEAIEFALKLRSEATAELVPLLYVVFDEKPLAKDGSGATEAEIIDAFTEFMIYQYNIKKNGESSPS